MKTIKNKIIGFVGLGHMGSPMVERLLAAGYGVYVYDRVPNLMDNLVSLGAIAATSIADLAARVDVFITMLQSGEQVLSVYTGSDGALANVHPQTLFIDCSTIDINTCQDLHLLLKEKHYAFVDAPVSGGVLAAKEGRLTFMMGGDAGPVADAKEILANIGKLFVHAGPGSHGQIAKICNNMLLGISMIGVCEAFNLGKSLGLAPEKFFEIASQSSGQCWSLTQYCPEPGLVPSSPANRDYQPGFAAKMMLKDLILSQEAAMLGEISTPLGEKAKELYGAFVEAGHAEEDFSGIVRFSSNINFIKSK